MNNIESNKGEIVMYQPDETIRLEVRVEDETVWLNRQQIADLFSRDIKTVSKHINNALKEELADEVVVAKFATTTIHGAIEGTAIGTIRKTCGSYRRKDRLFCT